jgi:phosphatidylserine synthase
MQQDLQGQADRAEGWSYACVIALPALVLITGLLMVSAMRYPHIVNRYLRGRKSIARLIVAVGVALLFVVAHRYVIGIGAIAYALWGPANWAMLRIRPRHHAASAAPSSPEPDPLPHSSAGR